MRLEQSNDFVLLVMFREGNSCIAFIFLQSRIGLVLEQDFHTLFLTIDGSAHERSLLPPLVSLIKVCAARSEEFHDVSFAELSSDQQHCSTGLVHNVDVDALFQLGLNCLDVSFKRCDVNSMIASFLVKSLLV